MEDDPELRMSFDDAPALVQEFEQNLKHGRAYIRGPSEVSVLTDCRLVLVHPEGGAELALKAQAVMVSPAGVGIELRPFDDAVAERMRGFIDGAREEPEAATEAEAEAEAEADAEAEAEAEADAEAVAEPEPEAAAETASAGDDAIPSLPPGDEGAPWPAAMSEAPEELEAADIGDEGLASLDASLPSVLPSAPPLADGDGTGAASVADASGDEEAAAASESDGGEDGPLEIERQAGPSRHERMRRLSQIEQQKIARRGELNDRVMLERLYGKAVWDSLLRNPKLTVPEVARIARKGTVPRPLLELIVDNNSWIQAATVRRALLSNPRVNGEAIMKLMRITPKHELKTILKSTAYSPQVRDAAKKVLG